MSNHKDGKYRWNGRLVKEKIYNQRLSLVASCKSRKKSHNQPKIEDEDQSENPVEGRRIINVSTLAKSLWCCSCKECLSLDFIEEEKREGFGSKLLVRCHKCLLLNTVYTDKQHNCTEDGRKARFNVNSKVALGKRFFNLF